MKRHAVFLMMLALSACETGVVDPVDPDAPSDLFYLLQPSGDPNAPLGIILHWTPPGSGRALTYDIYGRSSMSDDFGLRGTTTSSSFHDAGVPQLEYFVTAMDDEGRELGQTDVVVVDERNRLPAPRSLRSITLNGGVELAWDPNAFEAAPAVFDSYRIYSTSWSAASGCSQTAWALEGTTVSDAFVARNLPNGETRCFAVSAIAYDGHESIWSNVREDTPRHDARNIIVDASDMRPATSGFVFMSSASVFGRLVSDTSSSADIRVERRDGALWFVAARQESRIAPYGISAVSELTTIDRAPTSGYVDGVRAQAGYGYVVRVQHSDGVRYAAIRVIHIATDYVLFDYSFQSQANNTELLKIAP